MRQAREDLKQSRESVYESTRVSVAMIRALEDEDFRSLPADVYVRGFLRSLAAHLGLDGKEVLNKYFEAKREGDASRALKEGGRDLQPADEEAEQASPVGANLAQRVSEETAIKAWMVAAQRKLDERSMKKAKPKERRGGESRSTGGFESLSSGSSKRINLGLVLLLLIIAITLTLSYMMNRSPSSTQDVDTPAASDTAVQYDWKG